MNDHIPLAHLSTSRIYISLAYMGPSVSTGNNFPPSPSIIIEDIHNMGPWSAGPSDMGYYVGQVAHIIQNLSLKGLGSLTKKPARRTPRNEPKISTLWTQLGSEKVHF
jgi:hypothetical protein